MSTPSLPPFGLLLPTFPAFSTSIQPTSSPYKYQCTIPSPSKINEIVFYLMPSEVFSLPDGYGVVLYCCSSNNSSQSPQSPNDIDTSTGWSLLGAVTPSIPSTILKTNFGINPSYNNASAAYIGISIEPLSVIANINECMPNPVTVNTSISLNIAKDLYNFMASFMDGNGGAGGVLTVPSNFLDKWVKRFEAKEKREPGFFMKGHL